MSEFLTFALSKNVIFDQIGLFTSYLSAKRAADAAEYAKVATLVPDRPLLVIIAESAAVRLAALLGESVVSFDVDGDIMRFVVRNPAITTEGSTASAIEPDQKVIFSLLESYVMSATIVDWLRIVGYEFAEGPTSALKSAETMADSKLSLLRKALTPAPATVRPHKSKASPRRVPPI